MNHSALTVIKNGALLLWVALLPLQTRFFLHQSMLAGGTWEYGTLSLYATDFLLLLALVTSFFGKGDRTAWRRPQRLPSIIVVGAAVFAGLVFFASINALDVGLALGAALRVLAGLVAAWLLVTSELSLATYMAAAVASAALEAVTVLIQFTMQSIPASTLFGLAAHAPAVAGDAVVETGVGRFLRAYGTLPHPNMAAGWLAFGLIAASGLFLRSRDRLERAVLLAAFAIISAGLFLTFSRAGLLGWLATLLVLVAGVLLRERWLGHSFWQRMRRQTDLPLGLKMMKLVAVSLLLLGVFFHVFAPLVQGRVTTVNRLEAKSIMERRTQIDEAKTILGKHWLLGVGSGNYTKALHGIVDSGRQSWGYQPVHNVALLALVEVGVIGAAVFLWFLFTVLLAIFREHRRRWQRVQPRDIPWIAITSLSLFLLFLLGLVDHYLWSLPFGMLFSWLVFGLWAKSFSED